MFILMMVLSMLNSAYAVTYIYNVTCLNGKKGTAVCDGNGVIDKASSQACMNKFCYGGRVLDGGPQVVTAPNRGFLPSK